MHEAAARHDAYAADYDHQVQVYGAYIAEALFGLGYEFVQPGQSLLDIGIGSGLSAALFAKAGLAVYGMDFSPAMLDLCCAKGFAVDLRRHDIQATPWPYADRAFDHAVCCGVLHFIADVAPIFSETARTLHDGGLFAFTTKAPTRDIGSQAYDHVSAADLDVFSHAPGYIEATLAGSGFERLRAMRCFVGGDIFHLWTARKRAT